MAKTLIRIATRQSPLALWQARHVARLLETHFALDTTLVTMVTQGDRVLDAPLAKIGGKGLFVKELEQGLLNDIADIAVHSMKDVPMELPTGLQISAILAREDPQDALVSNQYASLADLPPNARIGTSSLRRACQIKRHLSSQAQILPLRGNVNTRLAKLDAGEYDAIILAAAGLKRLGLAERITQLLPTTVILPAVGQGAIGIEARSDALSINQMLQALHDNATGICVQAERAMNTRLNGGCQVPIAGFAQLSQNTLNLHGFVSDVEGMETFQVQHEAQPEHAQALGETVAERLLAMGAGRVLQALYA